MPADACRFGDAGSINEMTISGERKLYMDIVYCFQLGLPAHVTVENAAGVMAMSDSGSLRGFTAAIGQHIFFLTGAEFPMVNRYETFDVRVFAQFVQGF